MTETDAEVVDLRRRLDEAEETLRAIRDGEVDALLVRGQDEDQVFHLGGAGEAYRAFMEAMDLGAAALDETQRLLYANAALASLLGTSPEALQRDGLLAALGSPAAALVADLLSRSRTERQSAQIASAGPHARHLVVTAAPLPLHFATGWALTFTDITERVRAAAAEESDRIGRAIMESANEAVVVCDARGIVTHANAAVLNILDTSPVGRPFDEVLPLSLTASAGVILADDLVAIALSGGSVRGAEAVVRAEAKVKDLLVSAAPLRQGWGSIGGCIITLVDLTQRKSLEKRQSLLMRELDHRMKNMLTLVLSICTRTLATTTDLADFRERFSQRLAALAATQNLLAERAWTGLSIFDLVEVEFAPFLSVRNPRLRLVNLSIEISRDAAVALGLVLHELVTNAVKYGALTRETGRVTVSATPQPDGSLEILWREEGGPPVLPPVKKGFGQTVIVRGLGHSSAAPTAIEFDPSGVICRMRLVPEALIGRDGGLV